VTSTYRTRPPATEARIPNHDPGNERKPAASYPQDYYLPELQAHEPASDDNIWKPLTPYTNYQADKGVPAAGYSGDESQVSNRDSEDAANWDPNTYLYSYMKGNASSQAPVTSYPRDNSNIWVPSAAYQDNEFRTAAPTVTAKNDGSNIWKAGNTFANRQRDPEAGQYYYQAEGGRGNTTSPSSDTEVKKFAWPEAGPWY
jgi:hypothetical protein